MRVKKRTARRAGVLLAIVLTCLVLVLGWWQARARNAGTVSPVDALLLECFAPAMRAVSGVRGAVTPDPPADTSGLSPVGQARLQAVEAENRQLRELLALRERQPLHAMVAEVIGRGNGPGQGYLLLGKGCTAGVQTQMVVLTPQGVVGQVTAVTAHTARVLTLTGGVGGIGAMTARTRTKGVLKAGRRGQCRLEYLPGEADVRVGDAVITSGLGGVFASGLPLGTVVAIARDPALSTRTATVQPAADPANAEAVVLVQYH